MSGKNVWHPIADLNRKYVPSWTNTKPALPAPKGVDKKTPKADPDPYSNYDN